MLCSGHVKDTGNISTKCPQYPHSICVVIFRLICNLRALWSWCISALSCFYAFDLQHPSSPTLTRTHSHSHTLKAPPTPMETLDCRQYQAMTHTHTHTPSIFKTLLDAVCWEAAFANGSLTVNQLMCRAELKRRALLSSHYPPCARPVAVRAPLHR